MSVERRILPIRPRRRGQGANSKAIFSLPLLLSTPSSVDEEEDIRLSYDHAGTWSDYTNRKIRSSDDKSKPFPKPKEKQKQFVSVGIQHDGFQLPPARRSARVGLSGTDRQLSRVSDLFEGQSFYSFDFHSQEPGVGPVTAPVKLPYRHAETQTPAENLPQTEIPQWTYSKRRVRFVNRSRRKYMQEKRKTVKVKKKKKGNEENEEEEEGWICPFCDYEDIYKEPPYALISQYEMREKDEWRRATLHKKSSGNSVGTQNFGKSSKTFPDSYYEWESRPPDREGDQSEGQAQDHNSYGYSHDCYDYGG
ncbi:hypothetical protein CKK34_6286 [Yarrowia sp. E02]|nr:hypothetical protein CKK34_6286 [Yarrowia sp. E02]